MAIQASIMRNSTSSHVIDYEHEHRIAEHAEGDTDSVFLSSDCYRLPRCRDEYLDAQARAQPGLHAGANRSLTCWDPRIPQLVQHGGIPQIGEKDHNF